MLGLYTPRFTHRLDGVCVCVCVCVCVLERVPRLPVYELVLLQVLAAPGDVSGHREEVHHGQTERLLLHIHRGGVRVSACMYTCVCVCVCGWVSYNILSAGWQP